MLSFEEFNKIYMDVFNNDVDMEADYEWYRDDRESYLKPIGPVSSSYLTANKRTDSIGVVVSELNEFYDAIRTAEKLKLMKHASEL